MDQTEYEELLNEFIREEKLKIYTGTIEDVPKIMAIQKYMDQDRSVWIDYIKFIESKFPLKEGVTHDQSKETTV